MTRQNTNLRKPLQPAMVFLSWYIGESQPTLKLAVTLRYLASGNSYRSLAYSFTVPHNTISLFTVDVFEAIIAQYDEEVVCVSPAHTQESSDPDGTFTILAR